MDMEVTKVTRLFCSDLAVDQFMDPLLIGPDMTGVKGHTLVEL